ncbi:hypothetical protein [uncultured Rikenella sp.]|uniref:hypothetical protein n=1 Tax=uncultured Rikenella sp. TaxID=368003 RepID=UPI0026108E87|nr:hypothetical protein [uncultured Rikenella sp.]
MPFILVLWLREGTVLFVNKENQKNFRAHPCGMLWPCLPDWLGWIFWCGALLCGELPLSAPTRKIPAQRNKAEITRGRPTGTTSAKVLWVPFFQERYGSSRGKKEYEKEIEILFILKQNQEQIRTFVHCK